jgi:DNA-binding GntR family transcriptional regulator
VSPVTAENVDEVYSVREVFELLAVRIAAQKADKATIDELHGLLQQARESIRLGDTTAFSDLDLAFHRVIWTSTSNALAIRIGELIGGQIRLLVATTARAPGRFRGAFDEHYEIFRAIKNKNPAAAVTAMRRHLRSARVALGKAITARSDVGRAASDSQPPQPKRQGNSRARPHKARQR